MNKSLLPVTLQSVQIQRKEWMFVLWLTLGLLLLTGLPYVYAALTVPSDKHFMGFILNIADHAQYLSWYKAFETSLLTSNRMTSEPNPAVFFNLLWWGLAQIGNLTGLSYAWVYQILRVFAGISFCLMAYWFIARLFINIKERKLVFLLLVLSSGIGWMLVVLKYTLTKGELIFPLDLYVSEGNTFLCLMAYPHFLEAAAFILGTLALLLVGEQRGKLRFAVLAGLTAFLLGWQHGYDLIIVWSIPICYALARWLLERRFPVYWFKAMLITGLISAPPAIYNVLLTKLNPIWSEVLSQFANAGVYTPNFFHFFILMGLPLLMGFSTALGLLISAFRHRWIEFWENPLLLFLLVWFFAGWLLTYIPADFQIHMINSWQIPVILLAGWGIFKWGVPWVHKRFENQHLAGWAIRGVLAFCALTNLYLFVWRFYDLNRYGYPFFLQQEEVYALEWLEKNTPEDSVVLSNIEIGQYLPGISGRNAFLAHWAQTVDYYSKRDLVVEMFDATIPEVDRERLLQKYQVDYVLSGALESASSRKLDFLIPIWTENNVTIYSVRDKPTGSLP